MAKTKQHDEYEQQIAELTADLQRTRADFENYRKRVEQEKKHAMHTGESKTILKLLPVIDTIERATQHIPADIAEHQWVKGVAGISKQLEKQLEGMNLRRIEAAEGVAFDPELHQAIQFDEEAEGDSEVIAEVLQNGYTLNGAPIRHAMVRVTRK